MNQPTLAASSRFSAEDLLVGLCGFITSLLTAVILWQVEKLSGYTIYTWMYWFMYWFVVPVGAGLSGFAGASGYYVGSWFFGHRPTRLLLANIVFASLATFFLIHYLSYITLEIEGKQVSDYVTFTQYLDAVIRSTSYKSIRFGGSTGELGALGYVVAVLQVAGCGRFRFVGLHQNL